MSIRNCHYLPHNNPEKRSSQELKMLVELKPNFVRGFGRKKKLAIFTEKNAWVRVGNLHLNLQENIQSNCSSANPIIMCVH
jgi:hypothetical protein